MELEKVRNWRRRQWVRCVGCWSSRHVALWNRRSGHSCRDCVGCWSQRHALWSRDSCRECVGCWSQRVALWNCRMGHSCRHCVGCWSHRRALWSRRYGYWRRRRGAHWRRRRSARHRSARVARRLWHGFVFEELIQGDEPLGVLACRRALHVLAPFLPQVGCDDAMLVSQKRTLPSKSLTSDQPFKLK